LSTKLAPLRHDAAVRVALLSDIHGNLEALDAVMKEVKLSKPDLTVVLGDTINYGPNPRECLELIDEVADIVLAGNHEKEAARPEPDEMESDAREMLEWTLKQLEGCNAWERLRDDVLARGPEAAQARHAGLHFVHASAAKPFEQYVWPGHPQHHLQLNDQLDKYLWELMEPFDALHSFVGHTHTPALLTAYEHRAIFPIEHDWNREFTFLGPDTVFYVPKGSRTLDGLAGKKMIINPGSVGQPRDGDAAASWALYDGERIEFWRVPYAHQKTAEKVRALPLSAETKEYFAGRLEEGR
jgi:predicted phosphodiesterase